MKTGVLFVADRFFDLREEWAITLCTCPLRECCGGIVQITSSHHPDCYFRSVMDQWSGVWVAHHGEEKQA